jgi:putative FmdB family regulatory protein
MPLYPMSCCACGHEWESFFSMTAPLPHCEKCASVDTKRLISGKTAFALKGTGWASEGYSCTDRSNYSHMTDGDLKKL